MNKEAIWESKVNSFWTAINPTDPDKDFPNEFYDSLVAKGVAPTQEQKLAFIEMVKKVRDGTELIPRPKKVGLSQINSAAQTGLNISATFGKSSASAVKVTSTSQVSSQFASAKKNEDADDCYYVANQGKKEEEKLVTALSAPAVSPYPNLVHESGNKEQNPESRRSLKYNPGDFFVTGHD